MRRALRILGLGYRVTFQPLEGVRRTADIAFPGVKVAVMIDGCFWHGCPQHYRPSRQRAEFWARKVATNAARDIETNGLFSAGGWLVLRFWEHEDPAEIAVRVMREVQARRSQPTPRQKLRVPGTD